MLHTIIMAGGSGTRFWPLSRAATPKQLLNLVGDSSMIRATVDRLGNLAPPERTLIVTNESQAPAIQQQLPELPAESILGEPCRRDTAPCIGLAALHVSRNDPDAVMAVMPADHVIRPEATFQQAIRQAADLVASSPERIVTFGIRPTYPAEIFGYIQRGERLDGEGVYRVEQFREKPDAKTAAEYLASGDFYWNSGIFVWRAQTILDALSKHQPELFEHLQTIESAHGTAQYEETFRREFAALRGVSIDYAVMEHATDVAVIEAPYEWDDVGSWQALSRLEGADEHGNTFLGRHLDVDTEGTIVRTDDNHLVVTLGLKDTIVVHTPDATLVANRHNEEQIRQVVKKLEELDWKEYL